MRSGGGDGEASKAVEGGEELYIVATTRYQSRFQRRRSEGRKSVNQGNAPIRAP